MRSNGKLWISLAVIPIVCVLTVAAFMLSSAGVATESVQVNVTTDSKACLACHASLNSSIISHWEDSSHAANDVGCYECHAARDGDADAFDHYGKLISVVVTPRDCSLCHITEFEEFTRSHHAAGGNILASLDNFLAETVEGARKDFAPISATPGRPDLDTVKGNASAQAGCAQCHGSKMALMSVDGGTITLDELMPDETGLPTNADAVAKVLRDENGKPVYDPMTWPNTGIGRINLDGSPGACSSCHSRHDFSRRRARKPDNCGKCHMGPDHPQKEIFYESKHGIAFTDFEDDLNMDSASWILGEDYDAAPTCATCHVSGNTRNPKVTHDIGERLSWNNRPPISLWYDTDENGKIIKEKDESVREGMIADSGWDKRQRMVDVCLHCHSQPYVDNFFVQYDAYIVLYNEKFAKPGAALMGLLKENGMITKPNFDDEIEWVWWELWHHEGRRGRHGASMMGPDYAHWHGMYDVAMAFYTEMVPEARALAREAEHDNPEGAAIVHAYLDDLLVKEEHAWFTSAGETGLNN